MVSEVGGRRSALSLALSPLFSLPSLSLSSPYSLSLSPSLPLRKKERKERESKVRSRGETRESKQKRQVGGKSVHLVHR